MKRNIVSSILPALLLFGFGCGEDPTTADARVVGIRRSTITIEVTGPSGCVAGITDEHPIGEDGAVRFDHDVTHDFSDRSGVGASRLRVSVSCRDYFLDNHYASIDLELPLDTGAINRIPEEGVALIRSSAEYGDTVVARSTGEPALDMRLGDDGLAELPVAAPGATAIEVGGTSVALDPAAGAATLRVDLTPYVLASPRLGDVELSLPVTVVADGASSPSAIALLMDEAQVDAQLDRWLAAGADPSALPADPAPAILWRRADEPRGARYANIGATSTVGTRYLATEETTRAPIRSCGYVQMIGVTREVVLRDLVDGEEIARRSFPPPRRVQCPAVTFSNQPDRLFFTGHETIAEWLERSLSRTR